MQRLCPETSPGCRDFASRDSLLANWGSSFRDATADLAMHEAGVKLGPGSQV